MFDSRSTFFASKPVHDIMARLAVHTSDSGSLFLMIITRAAGSTERRKHALQPMAGSRNPPTTDARTMPNGAPVCMKAAYLALTSGGKVSPTYVCPVAYSPPTPIPVITQNSTRKGRLGEKPLRNVPML